MKTTNARRLQRDVAMNCPAAQRSWAVLFAAASVSVFLGLNLVAVIGSDFRGSDQYWYMADTQTLLDGGPKTSNGLYPAQVLKYGADYRGPFVHHTLNNYLVLPAAGVLGAFRGWVATNAVASIAAAFLLALLINEISGRLPAGIGFAVFLLLPFTVWQSIQPLLEATIAPFVAILTVSYALAGQRKKHWWGVSIAVSLLLLCRVSYAPTAVALPLAYLRDNRPLRPNAVLAAAKLCLPPLAALLIRKYRLISSMLTTNLVPGKSDDINLRLFGPESITALSETALKLKECILYHVAPGSAGLYVFVIPFNILVIAFVYGLFKSLRTGSSPGSSTSDLVGNSGLTIAQTAKENRYGDDRSGELLRRTLELGAVLLLLHFIQGVAHQVQFRYFLTTVPPLLCIAVATTSGRGWFDATPRKLIAVASVLLALGMVDASLALHSSAEGRKEAVMRDKMSTMLDGIISPDDRIIDIADEAFQYLKAEYCFRPAAVLHIAPWYDSDICDRLRRAFRPDWIFCPKDAAIKNSFKVSDPPVLTGFPAPYSDWGLYRLGEDGGNAVRSQHHRRACVAR